MYISRTLGRCTLQIWTLIFDYANISDDYFMIYILSEK